MTLATGIPESVCREINLGYRDWRTIDPAQFEGRSPRAFCMFPKPEKPFTEFVPKAALTR